MAPGSRRALPPPAIYLDSSVIRGAVAGAMRARDRAALCRMAAMVTENVLTFYAPIGLKDEIDRVPSRARRQHPREYAALRLLAGARFGWLEPEPLGHLDQSTEYLTLRRILPRSPDLESLFRARVAGVRDVVAADSSVLLAQARELAAHLDLRVFRPAEYLSRWSTQLQLPG
jgi:hypothetical protein